MTIGEKTLIDVTKSYVPLMVMLGVIAIVFQIGSIYRDVTVAPGAINQQLEAFKVQYNADLTNLRSSLTDLAKAVTDLRTSFLDPTRGLPSDVIRRTELYLFCLELERSNKGISCPLNRERP